MTQQTLYKFQVRRARASRGGWVFGVTSSLFCWFGVIVSGYSPAGSGPQLWRPEGQWGRRKPKCETELANSSGLVGLGESGGGGEGR